MNFALSTVADHLGRAIEDAEAELRLEQAVRGLDALDELAWHALLAARLRGHYEVAREVHYPSSASARRSHRQRCDLVLSDKGRPLRPDTSLAQPGLFDPRDPCPPEDALWLEVKVACQFREGGVRHKGYGAQWRKGVVADLRKMAAEPFIRTAALALIVCTESEEVLHKDLDLFETVLQDRDVLAGFRHVRSMPIVERIGHRLCTVALWPTIQRA